VGGEDVDWTQLDYDERRGRLKSHRTDEYVEKVRDVVHLCRRLSIVAVVVQLSLDKEQLHA
jgi:hypothetical protein